MGFLGLGGTEVLILLLAAAFLFMGSKKLPELAKGLGRAMGEFQKGRMDLQKGMGVETEGKAAPEGIPRQYPAGARVGALEAELERPGKNIGPESRIVLAARALGIATEGKTEEELRSEIARYASAQPMNDGIR